MIDNNMTLQLGMQLGLSWMRMRYMHQQELKEWFREIRRHQTLNRNANVLTKSEILRNAPPWRSGSTCPENLSSRNWIFLVKYSLRIPTPVHITPGSPVLRFRSLPSSSFPTYLYSRDLSIFSIQILRLISLTRFTDPN